MHIKTHHTKNIIIAEGRISLRSNENVEKTTPHSQPANHTKKKTLRTIAEKGKIEAYLLVTELPLHV